MKYLYKFNESSEEFIDIDFVKDMFLDISDEYKITFKESHQFSNLTYKNPDLVKTDNVKKITIKINVPKVYYSQTGHDRAKCRGLDYLILYSEKLHYLLLDIRVAKLRILDTYPNYKIKVNHDGEYHGDHDQMSNIEIKISLDS